MKELLVHHHTDSYVHETKRGQHVYFMQTRTMNQSVHTLQAQLSPSRVVQIVCPTYTRIASTVPDLVRQHGVSRHVAMSKYALTGIKSKTTKACSSGYAYMDHIFQNGMAIMRVEKRIVYSWIAPRLRAPSWRVLMIGIQILFYGTWMRKTPTSDQTPHGQCSRLEGWWVYQK